MTWFTSDYHLNHFRIIMYDDRPFSSIEEMNNTLMRNAHDAISKNDTVYYLGDLAFMTKSEQIREYMDRVCSKGRWYFLRGNHDNKKNVEVIKDYAYDNAVHDILEVSINGQFIVLCHYPLLSWNKSVHGSWHIHGHNHRICDFKDGAKRMNVAVNLNNYFPVSFDTVREYMKEE